MNTFLLAGSSTGSSILWLVILIAMVVLMLVLPSISQKKKLAAYEEMKSRLRAGDKIQTIGGIVGKINRIKEKDGHQTVLIETGDKSNKTIIEFDINAIAGVVEGLNKEVSETQENKQEDQEDSAETESESKEETAEAIEVKEEKPAKKTSSKKSTKK